jgi:hypothetical protein
VKVIMGSWTISLFPGNRLIYKCSAANCRRGLVLRQLKPGGALREVECESCLGTGREMTGEVRLAVMAEREAARTKRLLGKVRR